MDMVERAEIARALVTSAGGKLLARVFLNAAVACTFLATPASAGTIMLLQFEDVNDIDEDSAGTHQFHVVGSGVASAGQSVDGTDPHGGALSLDGSVGLNLSASYTDLQFLGSAPFTIDLWVRSRGPQSGLMQMLQFGGGATNIDIQSNVIGATSAYWGSNGGLNMSSSVSVSDGAWHHVAFQRDAAGGTLRFFIDGVLRDIDTYNGTLGSSPLNAVLGIGVQGQQHFFWNGWFDEIRVSGDPLFATTGTIGTVVFDPTDYLPGATVPEPGSFALIGVAAVTAISRGRRARA